MKTLGVVEQAELINFSNCGLESAAAAEPTQLFYTKLRSRTPSSLFLRGNIRPTTNLVSTKSGPDLRAATIYVHNSGHC